MKEINLKSLAITLVAGLVIWFIPVPEGVKPNAWHLLAIFVATIVGIILKAAPMGTMAMLGITLCAATQVLAPGKPIDAIKNALSGFGNSTIWLIGLAFFIARGFIKTGLGNRLAYNFIKLFGKSTLGLAYGLNTADLILAPAIPSNTARAGGVIFPIMKSIAVNMGSEPEKPETHRKIGAFLTLSSYNANMITSVMFLTATASNPMAQKFARDLGVTITWGSWAVAAAIPGLVCFMLVPLFLYKFYPPELKQTREAPAMAAEKLKEMGRIALQEWLMVATFIILLILWIFGNLISIDATTGALIGLCILLLCGVLTWEDVKAEKGAWDTIVWFSALVMMGSYLNSLGLIGWFGHLVGGSMKQFSWQLAFPLIILVYSYCHYMFASATAQVAAMYSVFLAVGYCSRRTTGNAGHFLRRLPYTNGLINALRARACPYIFRKYLCGHEGLVEARLFYERAVPAGLVYCWRALVEGHRFMVTQKYNVRVCSGCSGTFALIFHRTRTAIINYCRYQ